MIDKIYSVVVEGNPAKCKIVHAEGGIYAIWFMDYTVGTLGNQIQAISYLTKNYPETNTLDIRAMTKSFHPVLGWLYEH